MFIVPITKMEGITSLSETQKAAPALQKEKKSDFQSILKEAVGEADKAIKETREMDVKLASGEIDNLHTALIQAEQSAAAIEFTTQLASKVVNAYNQIMGMQV